MQRRDGAALAFIERHRRLLNAYLAAEPGLLDSALAPLLAAPRLIDFANKARLLLVALLFGRPVAERHGEQVCDV
jgi:hypothetical protein